MKIQQYKRARRKKEKRKGWIDKGNSLFVIFFSHCIEVICKTVRWVSRCHGLSNMHVGMNIVKTNSRNWSNL